jgi:hypothetical protein
MSGVVMRTSFCSKLLLSICSISFPLCNNRKF